MYKSTVTVVLFSIVVALVSAQCSCQTKPPTDAPYRGEACECGYKYPIQMEVPKITEHRDAHFDYGFTIERPQAPPEELKYTLDFHMEKPKPIPTASLGNYGFEVQNPVQREAEVPQQYSFDFQLQKPIVKSSKPSTLDGLIAHVDRVVHQKEDCAEKNGCQCSSYKPTIDLLQRCPKHGHLYREGGSLCPNHQRYSKASLSLPLRIPDQVFKSVERSKRNVANTFPIKINGILTGLRPNNQITKVPSVEDEKRIAQILKTNFGEDPNEKIDELLRPKPLGSAPKPETKTGTESYAPSAKSDFISKIKPKLEAARSNFRSGIKKIVNKARLNSIKANHKIQTRSTESAMHLSDDNSFDEIFNPIGIADESVGTENGKNSQKNANEDGKTTADRVRKHCDRCGELAMKFPCPSCGDILAERSQPRTSGRKPEIGYIQDYTKHPLDHLTPPRYVFDQYGRRYIENNRKLKSRRGEDVTVGSYHNDAYSELHDILAKNSGSLHSQNRRLGDDHLIQPMDFEHATDAIRFVQELTQMNNHQYNEDYYSNGNSYDVGARAQNYHAKRSFEIVPIAEKEDGSVFLKISPTGSLKRNNKPKKVEEIINSYPENYAKLYADDEPKSTSVGNNFSKQKKQKANFEKFVRNGKKYEILALSPNGSEEGSVGSEEDMDILKYIYVADQKDQASASAKILEKNEAIRTDAQTEI